MADKPPIYCKTCTANGVKTQLTFNKDITRVNSKGETKQVPLDFKTKQKHDCPFFKKTAAKPKVTSKIAYITPLVKSATIEGIVISIEEPKVFIKKDGTEGRLVSVLLGDDSGEIRLTCWDGEDKDFKVGDRVKVENGFVTVFNEKVQIQKGKYGKILVNVDLTDDKPDQQDIPTL